MKGAFKMTVKQSTLSDMLLDTCKRCDRFDAEALKCIKESLDQYDRPYIDGVEDLMVVSIATYGSVSLWSPASFVNDPWSAKTALSSYGAGYEHFIIVPSGVGNVSAEEAGEALYEHAKLLGFPQLKPFTPSTGYMVTFEQLRGSIPEFMRQAVEARVWDDARGQHVSPVLEKLREMYNYEVERILGCLRTSKVRRQVKNDAGEESWQEFPVTQTSFGFNRFDQPFDNREDRIIDRAQATAFFSVNDTSPAFNPPAQWNFHLQDMSRSLYAGCIALNYTRGEDGTEKVDVSSHH
jgi:hypothetical protein